MEDVPVYLRKPIVSKVNEPLKMGLNSVLMDRDVHKRTIDYIKLDGAMCRPHEVNRTLQV